jgi:hypothetical protein
VIERNIGKITLVDQKKEDAAEVINPQHQQKIVKKSGCRFGLDALASCL